MATATFTAAPTNATAAEFRDWGLKFSTALASVGLVKTADTGQIDWSTVAAPTAANQDMGYEIWRFNDSLQGTYPLFFKFQYGSGAYGPAASNIKTNIGKGSNGAGTLTSQFSGTTNSYVRSGLGSQATWYVSSADGSTLCWAMAPSLSPPGDSTWQAIERGRSVNGAPIGSCLYVTVFTPTSSSISHYTQVYAYGVVSAQTAVTRALPIVGTDTSMAFGGSTAPLSPYLVTDMVANTWQPRSVLCGMRLDMPSLLPITVPGWGTYMSLGQAGRISGGDFFSHAIVWS